MANSRPAVVLLSGGMDSTTILALAKKQGFTPYAMTFRYGQRHKAEIEAATTVAKTMGVEQHVIVDIDLTVFGHSALTSKDIAVPKGRDVDHIPEGIPVTYVPARNTIFLSFALAWAEVIPAEDVFIGVNAVDYSGYPDCRPEFIDAFEKLANLATKAAVEHGHRLNIHTPLINLSKADIIRKGLSLGVDYSGTLSCYDPAPGGAACGECDACLLRLKGFHQAGSKDPAAYKAKA